MRKKIYYSAGVVCLALAAVLVFNINFPADGLTNMMPHRELDNSYMEHYQTDFPLPKNNLHQGTVYLPVYNLHEEQCFWRFLSAFGMDSAEITELDDYFEASTSDDVLRIHKFFDLLEYENLQIGLDNETVSDKEALAIAKDFMSRFLLHDMPYDAEISRDGNHIVIKHSTHLSGLPNHAFPTHITMDTGGNLIGADHFFFDYESLGAADIITIRAALNQLPRDHIGKIHLTGYQLVYDIEDSILMPFYRFEGHGAQGESVIYHVLALKFY